MLEIVSYAVSLRSFTAASTHFKDLFDSHQTKWFLILSNYRTYCSRWCQPFQTRSKELRHVKNTIWSIFENLTSTGDLDLHGQPRSRSRSWVPTVTFQTKKNPSPNMYRYWGINPQRVRHLAINLFAGASSSDQNYVGQGHWHFDTFQMLNDYHIPLRRHKHWKYSCKSWLTLEAQLRTLPKFCHTFMHKFFAKFERA